jgi:hypothetical protein
MYAELYQYLILHKRLDLPGVGALVVERNPAQIDIAEKIIRPPAYSIQLLGQANTPSKAFFHWLGSRFTISEREAIIRFNDFLFELKKQLGNGISLEWSGVGRLSREPGGDFSLDPALQNHSPGEPVEATKVLRENPEHLVRVGEDERTSSQMRELLYGNFSNGRKSHWWAVALVLVVLSIIFIGYYFSSRGLTPSSAANQQRVVPQSETKTH